MKPFHSIAIPHRDVLEGRLDMSLFAANLWSVYRGEAPPEYQDPEIFFRKTYPTRGLTDLLQLAQRRLQEGIGAPVIQVQTPFGGGKTHALIALYHRAKEWGAHVPVMVGTVLEGREPLWALMAEELAGSRAGFEDLTSPGSDALRALMEPRQPLLILMDEVLEYITKAAGVRVGESTLAAQTLAFLQELTETVSMLPRAQLILTLPSSELEHFDEAAARAFQQIQKITGRLEKVFTPVQNDEIALVIRQRLFEDINTSEAGDIVHQFITYARRENILPGEESTYRERFLQSYPFLPEVIDILYERWGSIPTFQRTRGVLRLLGIVIHALRESTLPYITLSDFNLSDEAILSELVKHTEDTYRSVVASDITGSDAGARRVDEELGGAYRGYRLGTRTATAIFMHSFCGGHERGAHIGEIKLHATVPVVSAAVISDALKRMEDRLFYLQREDDRYLFDTRPNINRLLVTREEAIEESEVWEEEHRLLTQLIEGYPNVPLKSYLWPQRTADVEDSFYLKLVILPERDETFARKLVEEQGETPRVHRNTLFFVYPMEKHDLYRAIRRVRALESLLSDSTLQQTLSAADRKNLQERYKNEKGQLPHLVLSAYSHVWVVARKENAIVLNDHFMGIPTIGERLTLDRRVYQYLVNEEIIVKHISPRVLQKKYFQHTDYVPTQVLWNTWSRTPGETRFESKDVLLRALQEGVKQALFGYGYLEDGQPTCRAIGDSVEFTFEESEIIIAPEHCKLPTEATSESTTTVTPPPPSGVHDQQSTYTAPAPPEPELRWEELNLRFRVPRGKLSDIVRMLNYLQQFYDEFEIDMTVRARGRGISHADFDTRVAETFRQTGIDWERVDS